MKAVILPLVCKLNLLFQAFFPLPVFTEESNVEEKDLNMYIDQGLFSEAVQVYQILKAKGKGKEFIYRAWMVMLSINYLCYS